LAAGRWSEKTHKLTGGPVSVEVPAVFEWAGEGGFLLQIIGGDGLPVARWMIGRDDTSGAFAVLYVDGRGVSRIYQMSFVQDV
jgi:hypothetical protein